MNALPTLLPAVRALSRPEKLRLLQFLADDLVREEESMPFQANATYPDWSPHDAIEAATTLQKLLEAEKQVG